MKIRNTCSSIIARLCLFCLSTTRQVYLLSSGPERLGLYIRSKLEPAITVCPWYVPLKHSFGLLTDHLQHDKSHFALETISGKSSPFSNLKHRLSHLRESPHPYVDRHLVSWEQDGEFYILYQLATSDLRTYMRNNHPPHVSWSSVR